MAKKASANELTDAQIKKLGDKLIDTRLNVYTQAKLMFGEKSQADNSTFERLEKLAGIFKCTECNQWWPVSEKVAGYESTCDSCVAEADDDE